MLICIGPDEDGKFGFNVKVGLSLTALVCLLPSSQKAKLYVFLTHILLVTPLLLLLLISQLLIGWSGPKDAPGHIPH